MSKKINKYSLEQNKSVTQIAIIQLADQHTEVIGCLLDILDEVNFNIDIYHPPHQSNYSYINYYYYLFHNFSLVKKITDKYDYLIFATSREIKNVDRGIVQHYTNKIILFSHIPKEIYKGFTNIALYPFHKNKTSYILPIHNKYSLINHNKENIFTIVGLSPYNAYAKDINDLLVLLNKYKTNNYKINILTMKNPKVENILKNYKNVYFFCDLPSSEFIEKVQQSKFILTLAKQKKWYHKNRLSGSIPIAINNNIPLIIDKKLHNVYNLRGSIVYNHSITEVFEQLLDISQTDYLSLIKDLISYKINVCNYNKKTFIELLR